MSLASLRFAAGVAVVLAMGAAPPPAHGQVYKCTDGAGRTTYSDSRCAGGGKPLNIPHATTETVMDSSVCAQLQDEMSRLAANEKSGAGPSKRRTALHRQYESRCVGISRAPAEKR